MVVIGFFVLQTPALGHHGKEYLVAASPRTPHRGKFFAMLSLDYARDTLEDFRGVELEPAVLYGISPRWSIEIHSHVAQARGEAVRHESLGLEQRFRLSHQAGKLPFDTALLFEFEKGTADDAHDTIEGRLILSRAFRRTEVVWNLVAEKDFEARGMEWRYALATRRIVTKTFGIGLEMRGFLQGKMRHELTPGLYFDLDDQATLKVGTSFGLGGFSGSRTLRTSFIYAF